jgi:hypothetical protein
MALIITVTHRGATEPVTNVPLVLTFNGSLRMEGFTNNNGDWSVDTCPGANVHVTVNGIDKGIHACYDGLELQIQL